MTPREPGESVERCAKCGHEIEFDFLGPDPNDMDGERWGDACWNELCSEYGKPLAATP